MKSCKLILIATLFLLSQSALAFIFIRTGSGAKVHWTDMAPTYLVNNTSSANDTTIKCVADPITTFQDAFARWNSAAPIAINVTYGGTTSITSACGISPGGAGCDSTNVVLFANSSQFTGGILAITVDYYSTADGTMTGADVILNDAINWSDDPTGSIISGCTGNDASKIFALPAVATHEFGHFYGLDHSFGAYVGNTVDFTIAPTMYPFYFGNNYWQDMTTLTQDDKAGVYFLYPDPVAPSPGWGWITGTVKNSAGLGIFGAHMVAIGSSDAIPVADALAEKDGTYKLFGLPPGNYFVYTESPHIGGNLFNHYLSTYYSSVGTVPQPMLYNNIRLTNYAQVDPGSTTLARATAVTVSADTVTPNINFSYAFTMPGGSGHHHSSSSSCAISRNSGNSDISIDPPFIFILIAVFGLAVRSIARSKKFRNL